VLEGGRKGIHAEFWWLNLLNNGQLEDREGNERITLIWLLGLYVMRM
jgi:hypothetical protein